MGLPSPILNGARALVQHITANGVQTVGIFTSCTWSYTNGLHVAHTLGSEGPTAMTYTSREAVTLSLTGFRIVGNDANNGSPEALGLAPRVADLLTWPGAQIQVVDRENPSLVIMAVIDFVVETISTGVNARTISDITFNGRGRAISTAPDGTEDPEAPNNTTITEGT